MRRRSYREKRKPKSGSDVPRRLCSRFDRSICPRGCSRSSANAASSCPRYRSAKTPQHLPQTAIRHHHRCRKRRSDDSCIQSKQMLKRFRNQPLRKGAAAFSEFVCGAHCRCWMLILENQVEPSQHHHSKRSIRQLLVIIFRLWWCKKAVS